jgi:hypothetical protein
MSSWASRQRRTLCCGARVFFWRGGAFQWGGAGSRLNYQRRIVRTVVFTTVPFGAGVVESVTRPDGPRHGLYQVRISSPGMGSCSRDRAKRDGSCRAPIGQLQRLCRALPTALIGFTQLYSLPCARPGPAARTFCLSCAFAACRSASSDERQGRQGAASIAGCRPSAAVPRLGH